MKALNIKISLIAILFAMFFASSNMMAEPPCDVNCDDVVWDANYYVYTELVPACANCSINIEYQKGTAMCAGKVTSLWHVIEISWTAGCNLCYTPTQLYQIGMDIALEKQISGIPNGTQMVKMFTSHCWALFQDEQGQNAYWHSCLAVCCQDWWDVTWVNGEAILSNHRSYVPQDDDCSEYILPVPGECVSKCDDWNPPALKASVDETIYLLQPMLVPNPAKDKVTINFVQTGDGEVRISIIDINGKEVYSNTTSNQSNITSYIINTQEFQNGVYFYNVYYDGQLVSNRDNKFIIKK